MCCKFEQGKSRSRTLRGFTLVELLVVIAIIGVLVALLLPAVQAAREAARRIQCSNNLKQVGLAIINYESSNERLPPQAIWGFAKSDGDLPQDPAHHTWLTLILPYMEQGPLFDSLELDEPALGQKVVGTAVAILRCPSDGEFSNPGETHNMAVSNYAVSEGYHWWYQAPTPLVNGDPPNGIMVPPGDYKGAFAIPFALEKEGKRMAQIADGASNTVFAAEASSFSYKFGSFWTSGTGIPRENADEAVFRTAFLATGRFGQCCEGRVTLFRKPDGRKLAGSGSFFQENPSVTAPIYIAAYGPNTDWPGASSLHPGIVQVVMGDGSTHTISEGIDWLTWLKINGMSDGQIAATD